MRIFTLIALFVVMITGLAFSQTKLEAKWHCEKATVEHKIDIGDMPDHSYAIAQGSCTATSPADALGEKSGQYNEYREVWKSSFTFHGHYISTTEGGDKINYTYEGTAPSDMTKVSNKWKIVSGTGKCKGLKGSGSCSGKMNADNSVDWECTGTYTSAK